MTFKSTAVMALLALIGAAAHAQPVVQGGILTDAQGRTLYTFDKDQPNKSNCQGPCLQNWPAFTAEPAAGTKLPTEASRVEQHWTWNGSPLYYFSGDAKPGDQNGDGKGGVWHVVKSGAATQADSNSAAK